MDPMIAKRIVPFKIMSFLPCFMSFGMGGGGGGSADDVPAVPEMPMPAPIPTKSPAPTSETDKEVRDASEDIAKAEARRKGRKQSLLAGELADTATTEKKKLLGG